MQPIRPHFKPCFSASSSCFSSQKENMLSIFSTSYFGSTSNSNQYLGDDAPDTQILDSTLSKYTKCTEASYSEHMDDFDLQFIPLKIPQKCSKK